MVSRVNTRTNGQMAVHSRTHAYTPENKYRSQKKEVRSKELGVRNKEITDMHICIRLKKVAFKLTDRRQDWWTDERADGPMNEKKHTNR